MNPYLVERTIPRAGAASGLYRPSGLFAPLGMDSYFYSGCSENFIRNNSLVHFCDIFHSLRSWNISDNPLYFVTRRFASHDKIQWIIAGNDVNIFVSSVFNGEYYIVLPGDHGDTEMDPLFLETLHSSVRSLLDFSLQLDQILILF